MSSLVISVNEENFQGEVLESPVPVLLHFWAPWCGPCLAMVPALEKLAAKWDGQCKIARINVDENRALAIGYRITSLPTLMVFIEGGLEERLSGSMSENTLSAIIKRSLLSPIAA